MYLAELSMTDSVKYRKKLNWIELVEISILSINDVTVRAAKTMNRADKNWAYFYKIKYVKHQYFQIIKNWSPSPNFFWKNFFLKGFDQFSTMKNNFENQNFDMFEEVAHNFGKPDSDISYEKMLSFTRCICGFMPKSKKIFWQYLIHSI